MAEQIANEGKKVYNKCVVQEKSYRPARLLVKYYVLFLVTYHQKRKIKEKI